MNIVLLASCPGSLVYLEALASAGVPPVLVVTSPRAPPRTPLAEACERLGVLLERRDDANAADLVARVRGSELLLVAGWGRVLGPEILAAPRLGALNVHPSLLPAYRGREPLFWALLRGEAEVGVTLHRVTAEVDAGPIVVQRKVPVPERATSASLAVLVDRAGADLLPEVLALAASGALPAGAPQGAHGSHFPPLRAEHGLVDFTRDAAEIDRLVRAAQGEIAAYAFHRGMRFLLLEGAPIPGATSERPGRVLSIEQGGLVVAAGRGAYRATRFVFLDRVHDGPSLAAALGIGPGSAVSANPAFDV